VIPTVSAKGGNGGPTEVVDSASDLSPNVLDDRIEAHVLAALLVHEPQRIAAFVVIAIIADA
jgi:hypothetical protein